MRRWAVLSIQLGAVYYVAGAVLASLLILMALLLQQPLVTGFGFAEGGVNEKPARNAVS
jgi:hypothetical protein